MECSTRALSFDSGTLRGLSPRLLESHHRNNYAGAVKRLNAIRAELRGLDPAAIPGYRLNGLKREELLAANSMLLHELYFDSLGGDGVTMEPPMELALAANFGSVVRWREEFMAMGKALGGGSGWVLLTFSPRDGTLVNQWAADHSCALAGGSPILALDLYEHAYHLDYGAAAGDYVDAFMANVDWSRVYARYRAAVDGASEPLGVAQDEAADAIVLDVRRAGAFAQSTEMLDGARWQDPSTVGEWAGELPKGRKVVVYCVYGHEVGRATAMRLRAAGVDARFLLGGFEAWKVAGRPLQPARRPA